MANNYFQFKQFIIYQDRCAMKVTTDACLFGACAGRKIRNTEREIQDQQSEAKSENAPFKNVLDIGTGTGLLSLLIAQANNNVHIDAIEIDKDAFEQAKKNVASCPWHDRINVMHGDAKEINGSQQYDIIISNPPFYENELSSGNSKKNKAHHDEGLLLDELLKIIQRALGPQGEFYLLLPYKRNEEAEAAIAKNKLSISNKTFVKQSTQHGYFRLILSGTHLTNKKENMATNEIAITNEKKEYTPAFVSLLKDYYLYLQ